VKQKPLGKAKSWFFIPSSSRRGGCAAAGVVFQSTFSTHGRGRRS
jgi:hypothetical protein